MRRGHIIGIVSAASVICWAVTPSSVTSFSVSSPGGNSLERSASSASRLTYSSGPVNR